MSCVLDPKDSPAYLLLSWLRDGSETFEETYQAVVLRLGEDRAIRWFYAPNKGLGNLSPMELISFHDSGLQRLRDLVIED